MSFARLFCAIWLISLSVSSGCASSASDVVRPAGFLMDPAQVAQAPGACLHLADLVYAVRVSIHVMPPT
jgi:hypothetical protein